jgi:hypothetical protein
MPRGKVSELQQTPRGFEPLQPSREITRCLVMWLRHYATSREVTGSRPEEAPLGPGVCSTSNRNECQKHTNNVSGE